MILSFVPPGILEKREKQYEKMELEWKNSHVEKDQLIMQLEKSQEILLQFQKELEQREMELDKERDASRKLQNELASRTGNTTDYFAIWRLSGDLYCVALLKSQDSATITKGV